MTGGLLQLVGKGAQDVLFTGNPSFTHFRAMYKRHTEFAMEHFRLHFRSANLSLLPNGPLTLRTKVDRHAQLLHDCYLSVTIPPIYSPVVPSANTTGYEFQWAKNLGYNMINHVSIMINGSEIVRHTGEWMKLYAALNFDKNKKDLADRLVGNIPEMYDPANAFDRINQYPHAISTTTGLAAPSIAGRVLTIPFHFWFCETIGNAIPLIALQHSEVEFVVELKNMYQLFTVLDVDSTSPTFRQRISPHLASESYAMSHFLSPPICGQNVPVNPNLLKWNLNPFVEANYIFVSDAEMAHIATTDHSFLIKQIDITSGGKLYGPSVDLLVLMKNMCTRAVWVAQRDDRVRFNDYDNYTNWENRDKPPFSGTDLYSSGTELSSGISHKDIILESSIILDGKERFGHKQTEFFTHIQNYRHNTGTTIVDLPGIYTYSFAVDHTAQPSGAINGSQFNKIILRNTYVQPPLNSELVLGLPPASQVCVLKSTINNPNPTIVPNPNVLGSNGKPLYGPNDLITIVQKTEANTLKYTFQVRVFVESYNFLRVIGGVANVVFSS